MRLLIYSLIVFFLFNLNILKAEIENLKTEITKNLRCLVCQGQSVYDSDTEFANSIKIIVEKKLDEGSTEEQIYTYLKNKYGEWILYDPDFTKNTYFLWLLPILIFLIGGMMIFKLYYNKKNNFD
tara:strand:- start:493 stop:867 length:375 start_codon:yes stop_codon:yes gene_type:complete